MTSCAETGMSVLQAMSARQAVRAFLPRVPANAVIDAILRAATRAPSGANMQPWRVYVVQGEVKRAIEQAALQAADALRDDPGLLAQYREDYPYYPREWFSPYKERRRENGVGLYQTLGIPKGDAQRMHEQHSRNYRFFDAPVGLFFTVHRRLGQGALLDCGMYLQNVMLAAAHYGLATCPQAAWNKFSSIVLPVIGATPEEMLLCGMSLGYADPSAPVNRYRTPRLDTDAFVTWL